MTNLNNESRHGESPVCHPDSILSFGPQLIDTNTTRFQFWAPDQKSVQLEIEGLSPLQMTSQSDGWFVLDVDCGAGTCYRYRISDELAVPDPASQAQNGDVHDASVVVDHQAYAWQHPDWKGRPWHEAVLYELHVGVCGGFVGTMARLPALAKLGVTAIELMPVADFPGKRNWGYDGVFPYAPDASYGTPNELKALVDAAHGLGMMVFLDVVYNHFGPDGNYLSAYASKFFRDDIHTPWGQAIDFRVQQVRDFFTGNLLHWLQNYRFDGLRLDAVHAISERDWLQEASKAVRDNTAEGQHIHLVLENDDNCASLLGGPEKGLYNAQWNDDAHHVLHVLLTAEKEGYYGAYQNEPAQQLARCLSEGFVFQGQAPLYPGGKLRGEPSAALPSTAFVIFLQNHDQIGNRAFGERLNTLAHPKAFQAAQALLLLSPFIPLLFMGEESGSSQPFQYFTQHANEELATAVRDGRRAEFAHFAAFADSTKRDHIPDPNASRTFEQSIPAFAPFGSASEQACASQMQKLLTSRHQYIVPGLQGSKSLGANVIGDKAVISRWQLGNGANLILAINLGETEIDIEHEGLVIQSSTVILHGMESNRDDKVVKALSGYSLLALLEPA